MSNSLRANGATCGGGSEVLIIQKEPICFRDEIKIKIDEGGWASPYANVITKEQYV